MAKEILNRRQNIYAEDIPPEITDTSGFLEATDYATSTTGGTVKVDGTYQIELTSGGKLKAKEVTAAGYSDANDAAFISKATLDNLVAAGMLGGGGITITSILDQVAVAASGTKDFTGTLTDCDFLLLGVKASMGFDFILVPVSFLSADTYKDFATCANSDGIRKISVKLSGVQLPNNMAADVLAYSIKF